MSSVSGKTKMGLAAAALAGTFALSAAAAEGEVNGTPTDPENTHEHSLFEIFASEPKLILPALGTLLGIAGMIVCRRENRRLDREEAEKPAREQELEKFLEKHGHAPNINGHDVSQYASEMRGKGLDYKLEMNERPFL